MSRYIKLLSLCLALLTASCAEIVVKEVYFADIQPLPEDAHPAPIKFNSLRFLLPPGTEIGLESGVGPVLLGSFCSWSNYPVSRRLLNRKFSQIELEAAFEASLESIGYDVTNNIDVDFQREADIGRAEYFISARVIDIDLDLCRRGRVKLFDIYPTSPEGTKGKLYARIDWSVFDALKRTVVYKTTTEGYSRRDYPNSEGLELLFMDAFDMAAHNLGADKHFYNLLVEGKKPPSHVYAPFGRHKKHPRPRQFNPLEDLTIQNPPLHTKPFTQIAEQKRHNAVTIQKYGHGSGFFISKQGHILTNFHVIGESDRTRVILADRKNAITAEVLRVDRARDVALLKLTEIPDTLDIELLPIRTDPPSVSADIYAIGTPKHHSRAENTITKGIISNHRRLKVDGITLNFLQGDVAINPGNSGGPLLDEHGNIIGISVATLYPTLDNHSIDLNLFIPIAEALETLDITLK